MVGKGSLSKKRYSCHDIILHLESSLAAQKLPQGTKIPSACELKERYNVSMATMNRALDGLEKKRRYLSQTWQWHICCSEYNSG